MVWHLVLAELLSVIHSSGSENGECQGIASLPNLKICTMRNPHTNFKDVSPFSGCLSVASSQLCQSTGLKVEYKDLVAVTYQNSFKYMFKLDITLLVEDLLLIHYRYLHRKVPSVCFPLSKK